MSVEVEQNVNEAENFECTQGETKMGRPTKICLDKASVKLIGKGAFANVSKVKYRDAEGRAGYVALKQSVTDRLPLDEEIELLRQLDHPNIINMKFSFKSRGAWFVGMEYVEDGDLYHFMKSNFDRNHGLGILTELFGYQIFRALAYLHSKEVVHRDLKPENVLISETTGVLKVTDFGCSKQLEGGERNTYKVGTKEFRAPELLLHTLDSSPPLDSWSAAVIMTEMGLGRPLFGEGPADDRAQYLRIVEILGKPSKRAEVAMGARKSGKVKFCPNCGTRTGSNKEMKQLLMQAKVHQAGSFTDLVSRILVYTPSKRPNCWDSCAHSFFARVRQGGPGVSLPNGNPLPPLKDFSADEMASMTSFARKKLLH